MLYIFFFTTLRHVGLVQTWPLVIYSVVIDNLKDTLNNSCKQNMIGSEWHHQLRLPAPWLATVDVNAKFSTSIAPPTAEILQSWRESYFLATFSSELDRGIVRLLLGWPATEIDSVGAEYLPFGVPRKNFQNVPGLATRRQFRQITSQIQI